MWGKPPRQPKPHILEAVCGKCGETFIPADPQDIIHMVKEDGSFYGGTGDIAGEYYWNNNPVIWIDPNQSAPLTLEQVREATHEAIQEIL